MPAKHTLADVHKLVVARYPKCAPLPEGELLARLLEQNGIKLQPAATAPADISTTKHRPLRTLHTTHSHTTDPNKQAENEFLLRLRAARDRGLFRAIAVPAVVMLQAADKIAKHLECTPVSIDALLVDALEAERVQNDVQESMLVATDRAGPQAGEDWQRLQMLAKSAAQRVLSALKNDAGPLLFTEPGLLARYQLSDFLAGVRGLTDRDNGPAVFLIVPSHAERHAPPIDSLDRPLPVPVVAENEWIPVPPEWVREWNEA
jgi:hypothetical protein